MANKEHLELIKQGVDVWNKWRDKHPDTRPELRKANVVGADLSGADLSKANLYGASIPGFFFADLPPCSSLSFSLFPARCGRERYDFFYTPCIYLSTYLRPIPLRYFSATAT